MIYVFLRVLPFKHQELCLLKNSLIDTWDLTYDIPGICPYIERINKYQQIL